MEPSLSSSAPLNSELQSLFLLQKQRLPSLKAESAAARIERLKRFKLALLATRSELLEALKKDLGKSATEAELTELYPVLDEIHFTSKHLKSWMRPHSTPTPWTLWGSQSEIRTEPKGTALILGPWNYPAQLLLNPLVSALAAGCSVFLKPSEYSPHTSAYLESLIQKTFDPSEVTCICGDQRVAQALLSLPFDHVFFTGSPEVGKKIMRAAAEHLSSVTLELGGKCPAIVTPSAPLKTTAERIVWGKLLNAGQTCVAPDFVWVHASCKEALITELKSALARFPGQTESEQKRNPDYGRIIHVGHVERLSRLLQEATHSGAQIECGGTWDSESRFFAPTVVTGVTQEHALLKEEIFGPILPVISYDTQEEVLQQLRNSPKPLAIYVFGENPSSDEIQNWIQGTDSGGVGINIPLLHLANPELPFGGIGRSGQGKCHGYAGFMAFSHERALYEQGRFFPQRWLLFPPYRFLKRTLLRLFFRG
jgi:aldehyde dehydrogenase (NAD+)